jgi:hypothetical protein
MPVHPEPGQAGSDLSARLSWPPRRPGDDGGRSESLVLSPLHARGLPPCGGRGEARGGKAKVAFGPQHGLVKGVRKCGSHTGAGGPWDLGLGMGV